MSEPTKSRIAGAAALASTLSACKRDKEFTMNNTAKPDSLAEPRNVPDGGATVWMMCLVVVAMGVLKR